MKGVQKRKKGIETSNRILEIAAELFARKGYNRVSLREIASAASIRESSLFNHFDSKQSILQTLFEQFAQLAPLSRPSDEKLDKMLSIMGPEEIFKNVVFHVGSHINPLLENVSIIIQNEKFNNERAAEMYRRYLVVEPTEYYEKLITKMSDLGMAKKEGARAIAQQYNYVSLSLTQEYFMARSGFFDEKQVVGRMLDTLTFYCSLLKTSR